MKKNSVITFKKNELLINTVRQMNLQLQKEMFVTKIVKDNSCCSSNSTDILSTKQQKSKEKNRCECCDTTISSDDYSNSTNSSKIHYKYHDLSANSNIDDSDYTCSDYSYNNLYFDNTSDCCAHHKNNTKSHNKKSHNPNGTTSFCQFEEEETED
jgi:hypothetical protein